MEYRWPAYITEQQNFRVTLFYSLLRGTLGMKSKTVQTITCELRDNRAADHSSCFCWDNCKTCTQPEGHIREVNS